jgi:hypothetical protein
MMDQPPPLPKQRKLPKQQRKRPKHSAILNKIFQVGMLCNHRPSQMSQSQSLQHTLDIWTIV